jgi:hypothetical protein
MFGWLKKGEQYLEEAGEEPRDEVEQDDAPPGETENLLIIQHLCLIAGISAEIIADAKEHGGVDAEMLQSEADHYARLRAEAVQLADTITDEFCRGAAINFFIELCMKAREFKEARALFRHQDIKKFREKIVEKYPEIARVI